MAQLTRELSQASPVGTEVIQTKVVDNSAAKVLGGVANTVTQYVQTRDAEVGRDAAAATEDAVKAADEQFKLNDIEQNVEASLKDVERSKKAVAQGRIAKDRFTVELDARVKELKSRFPGHTDIIDAKARQLLGFDPRQATREIMFREGVDEADELRGLVNASYSLGTTVFNNEAVGAASGIDEVATANATRRYIQAQRLQEQAMNTLNGSRAGGKSAGAISQDQRAAFQSLLGVHQLKLQNLMDTATQIDVTRLSAEEKVAFVRVAQGIRSDMYMELAKANLDPEDQEVLGQMIENKVGWLAKAFGKADLDSFDTFAEMSNIAKSYEAKAKIVELTDLENTTMLVRAYGPNVGAILGGMMLNSELRSKVENVIREENAYYLNGDTQGAINRRISTIQDLILMGRYGLNEAIHLTPEEKVGAVEDAHEAFTGFGNKVLSDQEVTVFGNAATVLNDGYQEYIQQDKENLPNLIDTFNSPTFNANLSTLERVQPNKAKSLVGLMSNVYGDAANTIINPRPIDTNALNRMHLNLDDYSNTDVIAYDDELGRFVETPSVNHMSSKGVDAYFGRRDWITKRVDKLNEIQSIVKDLRVDQKDWLSRIEVRHINGAKEEPTPDMYQPPKDAIIDG